MDISYTGYPVFKGLQKPLEFMGIRGKFLIYAAAIVGLSFITFIIVAFLTNKLYGFLAIQKRILELIGFYGNKEKDF